MDSKLDPSSKPADLNPNPNPNSNPPHPLNASATGRVVPITRSPPYGATRLTNYNHPQSHQHRKNCFCTFLFWLILLFFYLVFIFAIAWGIFYLLFHPHRPNYSVSSLNLVSFKLTVSNQLTSWLDLTVIAYNPNTKIIFFYDPISITIITYDGVQIGDGSFPAFVHKTENTTKLKALVEGFQSNIDENAMRNLKGRRKIKMKIDMLTRVGVKIGRFKTKKIGVYISCDGIEVTIPNYSNKTVNMAHLNSSNKGCEVKFPIRTWKWTI